MMTQTFRCIKLGAVDWWVNLWSTWKDFCCSCKNAILMIKPFYYPLHRTHFSQIWKPYCRLLVWKSPMCSQMMVGNFKTSAVCFPPERCASDSKLPRRLEKENTGFCRFEKHFLWQTRKSIFLYRIVILISVIEFSVLRQRDILQPKVKIQILVLFRTKSSTILPSDSKMFLSLSSCACDTYGASAIWRFKGELQQNQLRSARFGDKMIFLQGSPSAKQTNNNDKTEQQQQQPGVISPLSRRDICDSWPTTS